MQSLLQLSWYEDCICSHMLTGEIFFCSFRALNVINARALANANIAVIVGAIVLRAIVYSALYWTLPRDKQALLRQQAAMSCAKDIPELTGKDNCLFHSVMMCFRCQKLRSVPLCSNRTMISQHLC